MTASVSRSSSEHSAPKTQEDIAAAPTSTAVAKLDRNWKKILKHGSISTINALVLTILATAAVGLVVTAGFMFSIGVGMPDGIYLIGTAIVCGGLSLVAAKKLYKYSLKTHQYLNPSSADLKPAPAA